MKTTVEDVETLERVVAEVGGVVPVSLGAALSGVTRQTLWDRVHRGTVRRVTFRGRVLVVLADLRGGGGDNLSATGGRAGQ